MDRTRNLFVVESTTGDSSMLLEKLKFKGLVTLESPTPADVEEAFRQNKSIACLKLPSVGYSSISVHLNPMQNVEKQFQETASKLHLDIGDAVSNSSGLSGIPSSKDCAYCKHVLNPQEYNVYLSKHFFVFPTLGQFIRGYLLIIPYEHVMSIAELDDSLREEFQEVLEDTRYLLNLTYGNSHLLVWENGTGNGGKGKAKDSIVHAHVHIAPTRLDSTKIRSISQFPMEHTTIKELSCYGKHSYLLMQGDTLSDWWINDNPSLYIPRQYVRQLIAEDENIPGDNWNWRTHGFNEVRHLTDKDIYQSLLANWKHLPQRLKDSTEHFVSTFQA